MNGNLVEHLDFETATDGGIAQAMISQVRWLRNIDEVKPIQSAPAGMPLPGK